MLTGVLFSPITPMNADGNVDTELLAEHVERGVSAGPGGVFAACGTGEFHALDLHEYRTVVETCVRVVGGRVPVFTGAGGPLPTARSFARAAAHAGSDGLLLMPPYLVDAPQAGLVGWVRAVASATDLDVIVYHGANGRFTDRSAAQVAQLPTVVGLQDGVGDLATISRIVDTVAQVDDSFQFFNGLPTAEATQRAYKAIGVPLYSSAVFGFVPDIAVAFWTALGKGDTRTLDALLREFFFPLVRLRDEVPGYAVSLVKAGVTLTGIAAGHVRAPLVDASPAHVERLSEIIDAGRAVLRP